MLNFTFPISPSISYVLFVLLILNFVYHVIYNVFISPLKNVPGPKLCKFTELPYLLRRPSGQIFEWYYDLHLKYGKVVRIGPNFVIFSSPDAVKFILTTNDVSKTDMIARMRTRHDLSTLFTATDKTFHKQRRRLLSPAFSMKYTASLEPLMQSCVKSLIQKINENLTKGLSLINIYMLVRSCTLDVIGETAFGSAFNVLDNDNHKLPKRAYENLRKRLIRATFPFIKFLFEEDSYFYEFVMGIIEQRLSLNARGERRNDILQIILDQRRDNNNLSAKDDSEITTPMSELEIVEQLTEFIFAGSDSSSHTITMALIQLFQHPEKLKHLQAELEAAFKVSRSTDFAPQGDNNKPSENMPDLFFPNHDTLKSIKYLNAVIDETMRLFPPSPSGIMRKVVNKETRISDYIIPENVTVCASILSVHRSREIWGTDADEFVPERWLDSPRTSTTNKEESWDIESARKNAFYPFGDGSRICIGYNFAMQQMRLILSALIINFEFEAIEGQDLQLVHFITSSLKSKKFEARVKRRVVKKE